MGTAHQRPAPVDVITWFILFQAPAAAPTRWWQRFLTPGYRHVMMVRRQGPEHSISLEHTGSRLLVDHHDMPAEDLVLLYLRHGRAHQAMVITRPLPPPEARVRPMMTCVEVVKASLGITSPWIVTPRQLARRLRLIGARPVSFPTITTP
jgi:hypothetical protein